MDSSQHRAPGRRRRGFSMIEVLVALLVTSVGLLGLAALQATSLRHNHGAYLRSQATLLAHDITERMRANRAAALSGDYDIGYAQGATPGTDVASQDLASWRAQLTATLPSGGGAVSVSDAVATVSVRWEDARGDTGSENVPAGELLEFQYTTEL